MTKLVPLAAAILLLSTAAVHSQDWSGNPHPWAECMALVGANESATDAGKMAVMDEVLNRAERWDMTPCEVAREPRQFATRPRMPTAYDVNLALRVLAGERGLARGAIYHVASWFRPWWRRAVVPVAHVGGNTFFVPRPGFKGPRGRL